MTSIQDFLDEKELEGIIDSFVETKYSIQFDKVMKELKDTTTYEIMKYSKLLVSLRNDKIQCVYKSVEAQHLNYSRGPVNPDSPYNKPFQHTNSYPVDNTEFFSCMSNGNMICFEKNRPMYGIDTKISYYMWDNREKYAYLL